MARLTSIQPRLGRAPDRIARVNLGGPDRDQVRARVQPWRAWYNTTRWRRLRWQVLQDSSFTCAECGQVEGESRRLVADHIRPHRGDEGLFWDRGNLQCLCQTCHSVTKQQAERASGR